MTAMDQMDQMDQTERYTRAGRRLRTLREAKQTTQQDIERLTAERYGPEGRVYAQQVSRIEKGAFDKPPIIDLLRYGEVLDLKPDDIAEMYGLWKRQERPVGLDSLDPRLREVLDLAERLPFDLREKYLTQIEFATAMVKAESRTQLQGKSSA